MRGPQKMKMGKQGFLKQKWEGCNLLKRKIGVNRPGKNYWPIPNVSECCAMVASSQMVSGFQCLSQTCWGTIYRTPHFSDGKNRDFLYNLPSVESIDIELIDVTSTLISQCLSHCDWFLCFTSPLLVKGLPVNPAQLRTRSRWCQDRRVLGEGRLVPEAQSFHGPRWLLPFDRVQPWKLTRRFRPKTHS